MNDIAIKVENLNKVYKLYDKPIDRMKEALSLSKKKYSRDHYALKDISFEIKKGETIGIIGVNGSGKSTLLKIITGVLTQTTGYVQVNGKISALLELGAGFNPEYTGLENIYLNGTMMGYSKDDMDDRVQPIVEFADIGEFINQPVKTYSSGMFARLAFAVAINVEPDILIVDEALSVGDMRFQIKCMDKMKSMMENNGTTVLFVSHDVNAIRRFCKRALWINKGEMELIGNVNFVCDNYVEYLEKGTYKTSEISNFSKVKEFKHSDYNIAEIVLVEVLDENYRIVDKIHYYDKLYIEVTYDVYDVTLDNPVIGIAIHNGDKPYVCGLNTLLDNYTIPWKYGRNKIILEYSQGTRSLGGEYFFDIAIMDKTASVAIQYLTKNNKIYVISEYKSEGKYVIPHRWISR